MSNPRNELLELDRQAAERDGISLKEYYRRWNLGTAQADAHWADDPAIPLREENQFIETSVGGKHNHGDSK